MFQDKNGCILVTLSNIKVLSLWYFRIESKNVAIVLLIENLNLSLLP